MDAALDGGCDRRQLAEIHDAFLDRRHQRIDVMETRIENKLFGEFAASLGVFMPTSMKKRSRRLAGSSTCHFFLMRLRSAKTWR